MSDSPKTDAVEPVGVAETSSMRRIEYFDMLRVVAIVAVVFVHVTGASWSRGDPATSSWQTLNFYDGAAQFCVPIFFMISGALFLDPRRNVTYRSIFRKSIVRLAVAYLVWSTFYAVLTTYGAGGDGWAWGLVSRIMAGHYHLWFLLALMGLYLATPILRRIVQDRRLSGYFLVLAVLFATVLPLAAHLPRVGSLLSAVLGKAQFALVLGYSLYFVFGYVLATEKVRMRAGWLIGLLLAGNVFTIVGTSLLSLNAGSGVLTLFGYLVPNVVLVAATVFLLARRWGEKRTLSPRWRKVVGFLATYSFGVYLVHPFVQRLAEIVGVDVGLFHPAFSVLLVVLVILAPSYAVAYALHSIPRVGRYLG